MDCRIWMWLIRHDYSILYCSIRLSILPVLWRVIFSAIKSIYLPILKVRNRRNTMCHPDDESCRTFISSGRLDDPVAELSAGVTSQVVAPRELRCYWTKHVRARSLSPHVYKHKCFLHFLDAAEFDTYFCGHLGWNCKSFDFHCLRIRDTDNE